MARGCPCGSGVTYAECCGLFHSGAAIPPTALALMRSRYSAFAIGDEPYLLASWHPTTRPASVKLDPAVEWRRLQIRAVTGGGEDDETGTVEFVAHYCDSARHQYGRQHERSSFARQGRGRHWLYVEPVP